MINLENIDLYWDDFANGLLNEEQELAIMELLEANPELLDRLPSVSPEQVSMPQVWKNELHKASLEKLDWLLVAELENCLSPEEQNELNSFEQHFPDVEKERFLMQHTRLAPEQHIHYPNKKELMAVIPLPWWNKPLWLAAASVVLIMAVWFGTGNQTDSKLSDKIKANQNLDLNPDSESPTAQLPEIRSEEKAIEASTAAIEYGRVGEISKEPIGIEPPKARILTIAAQLPKNQTQLSNQLPQMKFIEYQPVDLAQLTEPLNAVVADGIQAPSGRSFSPGTWVYAQIKEMIFKQKVEATPDDITKDLMAVAQEKVLKQNLSIQEGRYKIRLAGYQLEYSAQR